MFCNVFSKEFAPIVLLHFNGLSGCSAQSVDIAYVQTEQMARPTKYINTSPSATDLRSPTYSGIPQAALSFTHSPCRSWSVHVLSSLLMCETIHLLLQQAVFCHINKDELALALPLQVSITWMSRGIFSGWSTLQS